MKYLGSNYELLTEESVKLNGLFLHIDKNEMRQRNVKAAMDKMDSHFKKWSWRNLTTLRKILIVKCFGISQVIIWYKQSFLAQIIIYDKFNAV